MVEKKRKVAAAAPEQPQKKTRKTSSVKTTGDAESAATAPATVSASTENEPVSKSKSGRKRAADFLDDADNLNAGATPAVVAQQPKKSKKSPSQSSVSAASKTGKKKNGVSGGVSLTADGVNGVIEHGSDSEVEIATGDVPVQTSLAAEGLHTADKEMTDEFGDNDDEEEEEVDQGAALLAGFDSDTEDKAEDTNLDLSRTQPIPDYKKTSKRLRKAKENGSSGPGAVYVGRIPHGFYEQPMREYFSQFGDIKRLRLSRNKITGASKHFAFIEFESDEVAKIVADTMDNYLMFGHILKCKYAPAENLHPDVWKGANKKFRKIPHDKLEKQRLEAPKTVEQWEKKNAKEQKKREKQSAQLKAIGYDMTSPALKDPSTVVSQRKLEQPEPSDNAIGEPEPTAAIEAAEPVPEAKPSKKSKKNLKSKTTPATSAKTSGAPLTENNLDIQNADNAVEKAQQDTKAPEEEVAEADTPPTSTAAATNSASIITDTKSTKKKKSKLSKVLSAAPTTDNGDYEALSSIAVGDEAVGQQDTPVPEADAPTTDLGDLVSGVADAELKKRKDNRKSKRTSGGKSADTESEAALAGTTSGVQAPVKDAKADEVGASSEKKIKGILKKGKKQKV